MALKPCPRCGHQISDKARKCPKCGVELTDSSFSVKTEIKENNYEEPVEYPEMEEEPDNGNRKWVIIVILVIILGIAAGGWFYISKQKEAELARIEQLRRDSIIQDSIMAVQREAARLDSIRQDSIYRNFSTPDLAVFNLHGHVKSVKLIEGEIGKTANFIFFEERDRNYYNFDVNGNCTTPKRQPDGYFLGFKYDKQGKITGSRFVESGGCPTHEIKWNNDARIVSEYESYGGPNSEIKHTYLNEGTLANTRYESHENQGYYDIGTKRYTILERDRWGNWTKRRVDISGNSVSPDMETGQEISEPYSRTRIDSRIIEYYDMNEI